MGVSNQTCQPHMAHLPAVGIIKAVVIIKVAVAGRMTISLNTIPSRATPILDANRVILDEGPIPEVLLTLIHPGDVLAGPVLHPDLAEGTDLILTARPSPYSDLVKDMVIALGVITAQDPWTASAPDMAPSHPRRSVNPLSKPFVETIQCQTCPMKLDSSVQFL